MRTTSAGPAWNATAKRNGGVTLPTSLAASSQSPPRQWRNSPAVWQALEDHHRTMRDLHLRNLFADDPARGERMAVEAAGIYLDYSKNRINDETLNLLLELAEQCGLRA